MYASELNITIFLTFKHRGGLYFWSLLISSRDLTLHALGFILIFLVGTSWLLRIPLITTGWVAMVTNQSFVIYSYMHLVVQSQRTLRYILYIILTSVFALQLVNVISPMLVTQQPRAHGSGIQHHGGNPASRIQEPLFPPSMRPNAKLNLPQFNGGVHVPTHSHQSLLHGYGPGVLSGTYKRLRRRCLNQTHDLCNQAET